MNQNDEDDVIVFQTTSINEEKISKRIVSSSIWIQDNEEVEKLTDRPSMKISSNSQPVATVLKQNERDKPRNSNRSPSFTSLEPMDDIETLDSFKEDSIKCSTVNINDENNINTNRLISKPEKSTLNITSSSNSSSNQQQQQQQQQQNTQEITETDSISVFSNKSLENTAAIITPHQMNCKKSHEDDDDDDDEFNFEDTTTIVSANEILLLSTAYDDILTKLTEAQNKYERSLTIIEESREQNKDLEELIESLEEELQRMQTHIISTKSHQQNFNNNYNRAASISSEVAQSRVIAASKTAGLRMSRQMEARKTLLFLNEDYNTGMQFSKKSIPKNPKSGLKKFVDKHLPFRLEIAKIEAQFGSSVKSYFIFLRFIFLQFIIVGLVALIFSYFHLAKMYANRILWKDFFQSVGALPGFMFFSTYTIEEGSTYGFMIILFFLIFLCTAIKKLLTEDRRGKQMNIIDEKVKCPYSKEIFSGWDFEIQTEEQAINFCGRIAQSVSLMLEETRMSGIKLSRSKSATIYLYLRRMTCMFIYLTVQIAASSALVFVTAYSHSIQSSVAQAFNIKSTSEVAYIPLLLYNFINLSMPSFLYYITLFEHWDSGEIQINIMLFRMYLNDITGALIIALSYYLLANPFLFAFYPSFRNSFELTFSSHFDCNIDQAANNLFTLVLVSFLFQILSIPIMPCINYTLACYNQTPFIRPEFDVASNMISMFSFLTLIFLSFPFAPLTLVFTPIYFGVRFYTQYYFIIHYFSKPIKPWKSQKAANVFTLLYLVTLILICMPTSIFFLLSTTFPKSCNIQDDTVQLCMDDVDSNTNICTTNPSSPFYALYGQSLYPYSICQNACGPFIDNRANIDQFRNAVFFTSDMHNAMEGMFVFPYLAWILTVLLFIYAMIQRNTIKINHVATTAKEREHELQMTELLIEKEKYVRKLTRLQSIENVEVHTNNPSDGDDDDDDDDDDDEGEEEEVANYHDDNNNNNNNNDTQTRKLKMK